MSPCSMYCQKSNRIGIIDRMLKKRKYVKWNIRWTADWALSKLSQTVKLYKVESFYRNPKLWQLSCNEKGHSRASVTYVITWSHPRHPVWLYLKSFPGFVQCRWWCHSSQWLVGRRFWAASLHSLSLQSTGAWETSQTLLCSAAPPGAPTQWSKNVWSPQKINRF